MPGLSNGNKAHCSVVFRGEGSSTPITVERHSRTYSITGLVVRGTPHVNEIFVCVVAATTKSVGGPGIQR